MTLVVQRMGGQAVKNYRLAVAALVALLLVAFLVVEAAQVPLLSDPAPALGSGGVVAALLGIGLLIGDVVLPVASSVVMLLHGALFGVAIGALLSLIGATGAALVGFVIGRRGSPLLARVIPAPERRRADELLDRWGLLAVIVTRPVPLLAEAVAMMAGASRMRASTIAVGAAIGALPAAVLYAVAGALAVSFVNGALVFGAVILLAGAAWLLGRTPVLRRRQPAGS